MSGFYAADGSMNITVVSGSSRTGLYAADGSINVVLSTGLVPVGVHHPCGGLWVTVSPSSVHGIYAPDGSFYVSETPFTNGGVRVHVNSGSLSEDITGTPIGLLLALTISVGGGEGEYAVDAVHFGGSTYLSCASLTCSDNGLFSFAVFQKVAAIDYDNGIIWVSDPDNFLTYFDLAASPGDSGVRNFDFEIANVDDFTTLGVLSQDGTTMPGQWVCVSGCANATTGVSKLYLNDTDITSPFTDSTPFTPTINGKSFVVGGTAGLQMTGDLAQLWVAPGQFIDFTVEANRRKFVDANGKPVDLGADGSTPTGTAPAVFFAGDQTAFATNRGTGGSFTLNGSLTNATTSPSD